MGFVLFTWACPFAIASGSGYTLQVLAGYACFGLSATIPHAENKVKKFV